MIVFDQLIKRSRNEEKNVEKRDKNKQQQEKKNINDRPTMFNSFKSYRLNCSVQTFVKRKKTFHFRLVLVH